MIHTSYFANIKNLSGRNLVSISNITPQWAEVHKEYKELAPSKSILYAYKNKEIDEIIYTERYKKEILSRLDPHKVYKDLEGSVLLCYEKRGDFCHRNIVAEWLQSYGYKVKEIEKHANIAVIGSRGFSDRKTAFYLLDKLTSNYETVSIVSGGAAGADSIAEEYAKERDFEILVFPAEWDKYGKSAGYIRNNTIWDNADIGIAFWDGQSKGTAHSFGIAKSQKKKLFVYNYVKGKFEEI